METTRGFRLIAIAENDIDLVDGATCVPKMPDWTLSMALAWIAWRVTDAVREHCADYRKDCLFWFPGSWNIPTGDGIGFKRIDGYELRSFHAHVLTTFTSYGAVASSRQAEILEALRDKAEANSEEPDQATVQQVVEHLMKKSRAGRQNS